MTQPAFVTRSLSLPSLVRVELGPIAENERADLFRIFSDIVEYGEGWPQLHPLSAEDFEAIWGNKATIVVSARIEGAFVGAYYLKANYPGKGAHIANAGYVVERDLRGQGVGKLLVEDSLMRAPLFNFDAIQFNLVFSSNPAWSLYERLGWREIGRVPEAIDGEDAIIYWRSVGP